MLSAILFAQDREASQTVERLASGSGEVCIYRTMHAFPTPYELTRLLNSFTPDLVLVELEPLTDALTLVRAARLISPGLAVAGYRAQGPAQSVEEAAEAGVLEILSLPMSDEAFRQCLMRAMRRVRPEVQVNLLAFLPAKAGSGASTVAINVAGALARSWEKKVLLIDADLHSGLVSVLLKVTGEYTLAHALENAALLDGTLWRRIVSQAQGMDLLVTPKPSAPQRVSWTKYHQLLQFVGPRYETVVVDLPEVVSDATVEIVRRASKIFIVATAELPSLVLARQRARDLKAKGAPPDRIGLIVNRWQNSDVDLADIERFAEERVAVVIQNDYQGVRRAIQEGRLVGPRSELGRSFATFSKTLLPPEQQPKPRSFFAALMAR